MGSVEVFVFGEWELTKPLEGFCSRILQELALAIGAHEFREGASPAGERR